MGLVVSIYILYVTCYQYVFLYCLLYGRSSVRVVASNASGMGKSLYVKKLAEQLRQWCKKDPHVIVPVHGPVVNTDIIMASLCHHIPDYSTPPAQIIHLDIAPSVSKVNGVR